MEDISGESASVGRDNKRDVAMLETCATKLSKSLRFGEVEADAEGDKVRTSSLVQCCKSLE